MKEMLNRQQVLPGVKKIIAVASGKGGVGKSTVAVSLALAAAGLGKQVGLVDADIYGPSVPKMMGLNSKPDFVDGKIIPLEKHGVLCNSIGFLVDESQATIWRGPMATKALHQLIFGTNWAVGGGLDILFIDMPPGTGDIQLSIAQNYKVDAAVLVSTPQQVALLDVKKALAMFERVKIPVLGVVENMSYFVDDAGKKNYLFGNGNVKSFADQNKIKYLAEVPVEQNLATSFDKGEPQILDVFKTIAKELF